MVPGLVDPLKTLHELFVATIIYSGMGREQGFKGPIVKGQQFFKGTVAGPEQPHITIYGVTGDAQGRTYFAVAETVQVQSDDLF
jgi:hypothetical protein